MVASTDKAYVAGILDGEGYITIRRSNRYLKNTVSYRLVVGFTNTDLSLLEWIQSLYGGCINQKSRASLVRHSIAWELTIHKKEDLSRILQDVKPYIKVKAKQLDLALRFSVLGKIKKSGTWPVFKALPEELSIRESFKAELTELNRRGPCLP